MLRVKVVKEYLWAPDGNNVRTVQVGEELDGEAAEIALQMHAGEVLEGESAFAPAPASEPTAEPATPAKKKGR